MNKNYYGIIMAGGVGSRFWPMSTQDYPKQFHDMLGKGLTLIQKTFKRLEKTIPSENILISTNKRYDTLVLDQLSDISKDQLLLEPCMRNTAACILYAALKIYSQNPEAIMVIAPSDHWIDDETTFNSNLTTAFEFCEQHDVLMTLGITPSSPNTGYGYIQYKKGVSPIKKVQQFTEKPDSDTAEAFIESGDYLWNAGIFIWSAKSILSAFKKQLPEMFTLFSKGNKLYNTSMEVPFIEANYPKAANISIDFSVLENATNIHVLPVDFGWNDLGTWGSLYNKLPKDDANNVAVGGEVLFRDASNNMIRTSSNKKIVIQGLKDYIIIEKNDILLICPKENEQDIKQITAQVKSKFGDSFV